MCSYSRACSIEYREAVCRGCDNERPIVNRFHMLCGFCNQARLRAKKTYTGPVERKPRTPIRQVSKKQAAINSKKAKTRKEIHARIGDFCTGCHRSGIPTDDSHYLSVGRFKKYELVKENRTRHCRDCHNIWEHGTLAQKLLLKDFAHAIAYIKRVEPGEWHNILNPIKRP